MIAAALAVKPSPVLNWSRQAHVISTIKAISGKTGPIYKLGGEGVVFIGKPGWGYEHIEAAFDERSFQDNSILWLGVPSLRGGLHNCD